MRLSEEKYDCVVAVMPVDMQAPGTAFELLRRLAEARHIRSVPVLVFGSDLQVGARRAACLGMGARCYAADHYELLQELTTLLDLTCGDKGSFRFDQLSQLLVDQARSSPTRHQTPRP